MLDFSNAPDQEELKELNSEEIKTDLHNRLEEALLYLFPHGKIRRDQFMIGDIYGNPGDSLHVELSGSKIGLWHDFATGEGGDIISLWGAANRLNSHTHFPEIIDSIQNWLGTSPKSIKKIKLDYTDNLGAPTHKWDYTDAHGDLIASVYRFDPPTGKKIIRPWDVKARKYGAPDPRPLYNQPNIQNADEIILVEGEKCADALISQGICATTAMGGANAPVDKTDWTPLTGKHVIIWPDNDQAGIKYAETVKSKISTLPHTKIEILKLPANKPEKWDVADAVLEGFDILQFLKEQKIFQHDEDDFEKDAMTYEIDESPEPTALVAPYIILQGNLFVFGGPPKVGKTDFLLNWLIHMAAGLPFLEMTPPRPLKIYYLQTEVSYYPMRERIKQIKLDPDLKKQFYKNIYITKNRPLILDEKGIFFLRDRILNRFPYGQVDIIAIDPLRNVYPGTNENDNAEMAKFLLHELPRLRNAVNPNAAIILIHHTRKITKAMLEEDPFQAFSGAGSLRSSYDGAIMMYRSDEKESSRNLLYELRNGKPVSSKLIDKIDGSWIKLDKESERLVKQSYGEILDSERQRKHDVILQIIYAEAQKGNLYQSTNFAEAFENKAGLGSETTIRTRINVLATKGYIKFNKDKIKTSKFGRTKTSKYGFMVIEGMKAPTGEEIVNPNTGEIQPVMQSIFPTHYKDPETSSLLPVENPEKWVYPSCNG